MEIINGYKVVHEYLSRTEKLYLTEVLDPKDRCIARKYYANNEVTKTYYLEGKILYDENGEIDIAYNKGSYILFDFPPTGIKINVTFDESDPYTNVERFIKEWEELLPFMTQDIINYFTKPEPLIPPVTLQI